MVGDKIKRLREEQRLTQDEVARQSGVSTAWLSKVENNLTRRPDPMLLRAIARPLQVDPDELLTAAGYLVGAPSIDQMSAGDILDQVDRLLTELKRRTSHRRDDSSSVRRYAPTRIAVAV